jgi:signal transduction histidine kinase
MRHEILRANQALIESERLATIGRMAGSVSHDLRHYLAAIYANSEFLVSHNVAPDERNEVLSEIRNAVNGTTEMLESLLMFGRTGHGLRRSLQSIPAIVEGAFHLVRAHPDAAHVAIAIRADDRTSSIASVDPKQIERAIYNLILNGCQAPRAEGVEPRVEVSVVARNDEIEIDVADNGEGVPASIRTTLFEAFVSEGKHKGSGLGLTLTQSIALEHGGSVTLVRSMPGETVFRILIPHTAHSGHSFTGSQQVGEP